MTYGENDHAAENDKKKKKKKRGEGWRTVEGEREIKERKPGGPRAII